MLACFSVADARGCAESPRINMRKDRFFLGDEAEYNTIIEE